MSADGRKIASDLRRHAEAFRLDSGLGVELAEASASGIFEYMEAMTDPSNAPWQPLSPKYAAWKAKHYPGRITAERELEMKAPDHLKGQLEIQAHMVIQTYGLNEQAKNEAAWFQEGDPARNRPPRRFYDLNDLCLLYLSGVLDAHFSKATS